MKKGRIVTVPSWKATLQSFSINESRTFINSELRIDKMRRHCSEIKRKYGCTFEVNEIPLSNSYLVTRKK